MRSLALSAVVTCLITGLACSAALMTSFLLVLNPLFRPRGHSSQAIEMRSDVRIGGQIGYFPEPSATDLALERSHAWRLASSR
jgi:hypothetical protein